MLDGIRGVFSREAPHRTLTLALSIIDGPLSAFFYTSSGFSVSVVMSELRRVLEMLALLRGTLYNCFQRESGEIKEFFFLPSFFEIFDIICWHAIGCGIDLFPQATYAWLRRQFYSPSHSHFQSHSTLFISQSASDALLSPFELTLKTLQWLRLFPLNPGLARLSAVDLSSPLRIPHHTPPERRIC